MFKKEYPFGGVYYKFGPVHLDWEYKHARWGKFNLDWASKPVVDLFDDAEPLSWKELDIEFPACRSCVQGRPDNCCCI